MTFNGSMKVKIRFTNNKGDIQEFLGDIGHQFYVDLGTLFIGTFEIMDIELPKRQATLPKGDGIRYHQEEPRR